jgi:hypothetical protein
MAVAAILFGHVLEAYMREGREALCTFEMAAAQNGPSVERQSRADGSHAPGAGSVKNVESP